jgi:DNA repair protein RAD50
MWEQEIDLQIVEAQAPIDLLEREHNQVQNELNAKIAEAQRLSQELNMSVDKLDITNKAIERCGL